MYEITLANGRGLSTLLWTSLAAMILVTFFYQKVYKSMRPGRYAWLLGLRLATVVVVVLLLFRPTLNFYKETSQKKSVAFVVDTSASMSIADDPQSADKTLQASSSRLERAKEKIRQWWSRLQGDFNLHLVEFSEESRPLRGEGQLAALSPEGKSTSLSYGMAGGVNLIHDDQRVKRSDIEGVFLFSDGIHNSGRRPAEDAEKLGIPVFTIGVGSSLSHDPSYRDIRITGVDCPERLFVNNQAKIAAQIDAVGLSGRVVRVLLEELPTPITDDSDSSSPENGAEETSPETTSTTSRILDEVELTLDGRQGGQEVEFQFQPEETGKRFYHVRVPPVEEEAIRENNHQRCLSLVVEPGIRVLYLEGTLRPEYGALCERFLSKDPDLEFLALVQTRPNVFLRRSNIGGLDLQSLPEKQETIDTFDVFLLGDLDSSYLNPQLQRWIADRVRSGAGLVMLGGYHSLGPGGYADTPIGEILPVMVGDREIGQFQEPFLPKLTPEGTNSHIFSNIVSYFPTPGGPPAVEGLPDLHGCTRVQDAKPASRVLATCPDVVLPSGREMPVLSVMPVEKGRAAVFTADTTRLWQQGPRALGRESPFLQFWGQLVRFLVGQEGPVEKEAGCSAETDQAYYEPQEPIRIEAVVRNDQGQGTDRANVTAVLRYERGKVVEQKSLTPESRSLGKYSVSVSPKHAGRIEIEVTAQLDGKELKAPESLVVEVGRPNMEFDRLDLDEEMLGRIAQATGGQYAHLSTADHLVDQLDRQVHREKVLRQISLAPPVCLWGMFVLLLTAEWFTRRRWQLR